MVTVHRVQGEAAAAGVRLALCASGEIWGGVEQFIMTLSRQLMLEHVPVLVIVLYDGPLLARLKDAGVPTVLVAGGRYSPSSVLRVAKILRTHEITVLHTHGYKAAVLGGMAASLAGVAHVRTEHGRVEPWSGRARVKMEINSALEHAATRWLTHTVVFVSGDIQTRSRVSGCGVVERVIHNGIEPAVAAGEIRAADVLVRHADTFWIGIVGRIAPVKGHEYLIRAAAQLHDLPGIRIAVLGSGPMEEECRQLCAELGLGERVQFLGFRPNIADYMRQLDVLAMPSRHEGLPYTLLEAMEHKIPVVASAVGGLAEVLQDGVTGLLVPSGDVSGLASALRRLHDDACLRKTLASNAHDALRRQFLASHMASAYVDVYRRAVADRVSGKRPRVEGAS